MIGRTGRAGRWLVVLVAAVALVAVPLAVGRRPAAASSLPAVELLRRVQASAAVPWSGTATSTGALQVPESTSFASLADLLGGQNTLRVWWRAGDDFRVDRIRSTGETDLFRDGRYTTRWVFESETATISPVSRIRLPDASDLLPPTLARSVLRDARPAEVAPLPSARVAGRVAAGLRLTPDEPAGTTDHVDVWVDPGSGIALRVELYGRGDRRPVVSTTMTSLDLGLPPASTTSFSPSAASTVSFDESVDVAAAANALTGVDLPATLAGLGTRDGAPPGAVAVYGRGATALIVLPLRGSVAYPLRHQLQSSGAQDTSAGTFAPVGPIGVLLTPPRPGGPSLLLAGTVTEATLRQAAGELAGVA